MKAITTMSNKVYEFEAIILEFTFETEAFYSSLFSLPTNRKEYGRWLDMAKREETKAKHLDKMIKML